MLADLSTESALVFGNSIGALIGLNLAAKHPGRVRALVAHEPPAPELLPDSERTDALRAWKEVQETHRREGVAAAMNLFMTIAAVNSDDRESGVEPPAPTNQRAADLEFFLTNDFPAVRRHRLDIAALKAAPTRIVPAGGVASRRYFPYHCAEALADRIGARIVEFPGDHIGYANHPRAFAARLREVLAG